jgi:branched-chain amino acid transport system permease protein
MLYREAGQFRTSYRADERIFPILQDRVVMAGLLVFAFVGMPLLAGDYLLTALVIPWLILTVAALGLNILTGYAGQFSLGTAGFMAVGAFAAYNFQLRTPQVPLLVTFVLSGLCAAAVGLVFGLPSLRIRGLYVVVATLASQFFIEWLLTRVGWFTNYSSSGVINAQQMVIAGVPINTPVRRYLLVLAIVALLALAAKNLVRSRTGRAWMAVRDMDVAAEVIGIPILGTKLSAFAVSSFYCGVSGALWAFAYLGTVEPQAFDLTRSFQVLTMVIIGGLGSVLGSFLGAGFIVLFPVFLTALLRGIFGDSLRPGLLPNIELFVFGALIIFFLIVEPHGLARLWQIAKEKLRLWPFPH